MSKYVYDGWKNPSVQADPPNTRFMKIIMSPEVNAYKEAIVLNKLLSIILNWADINTAEFLT